MKKIVKRISAYIIDILIVELIVGLISSVSIINTQKENYNQYYQELTEEYNKCISFSEDFEKYYKDKEINKEEYDKLLEKHNFMKDTLEKYYEDEKITEKEQEKIQNKINKIYETNYKDLQYKIIKNSTIEYTIYIIIVLIYFVIVNYLTKGQTIGKKILRLQIVNKEGKKANIINYLIRSLLLYDIVYYIAYIIGVYTLNANDFYTLTTVTSKVQSIVELTIMLMMIIRIDGRGLHDVISGTKVNLYDKEGNEILEDNKGIFSFPNLKPQKENDEKIIEATVEEKNESKEEKKQIEDKSKKKKK